MTHYRSSLQSYRDVFTKYKSSFITKTDSRNVDTLNDLIKLAFEQKTIITTVLLGPKGSGKKKTLQLAVNKNNVNAFISINCLIYSTPILVYEKLLRECEFEDNEISQSVKLKLKSSDKISESWLKVLCSFFQNNNTVIYFSNFERITKQKQSFFYSLLDGINLHGSKCFLTFGTSSLTFWDSLEKRIKSRFSFTLLFFGLSTEDIMTFFRNFITNSFEPSKITEAIKIYMGQIKIEKKIRHFFEITQSYRMLISLFAGVFCRFTEFDLRVFEENPSLGIDIFEQAVQKSVFSLLEYDHSGIVASLSDCHRIILRILLNNIDGSSGLASIKMNNLMALIQSRQNGRGESIVHRYDQISTFSAVNDLVCMKYAIVKPFPISQYSEIFFVGNPNLRNFECLRD